MKAVVKFLFTVFFIVALFSACNKNSSCNENSCPPGEECLDGDCVYITPLCEACGTYEGLTSGTIETNIGLPFDFTDLPISIVCNEESIAYDYTITIDMGSTLGAAPGTFVPAINVNLIDQTLIIENETYVYQGIASVNFDGIINFSSDFEVMSGTLELTGDARADLTFSAQRQ